MAVINREKHAFHRGWWRVRRRTDSRYRLFAANVLCINFRRLGRSKPLRCTRGVHPGMGGAAIAMHEDTHLSARRRCLTDSDLGAA
jgi:hypothetical protein